MTPIEAGAPNRTAGNRRPVQLPATQSSSRGPSCRAYLMGFSASFVVLDPRQRRGPLEDNNFEASDPALAEGWTQARRNQCGKQGMQ